jgi:hypothetical protein
VYRDFYGTGAHRSANRDGVHPDFEDETTGLRVALTLSAD